MHTCPCSRLAKRTQDPLKWQWEHTPLPSGELWHGGAGGGSTRLHAGLLPAPTPRLSSSCSLSPPKPQEHLEPPQEDAPHPTTCGGPLQVIISVARPLCFLPVPITFCSLVPSPLNYDKPGPSFISVSKTTSRQPTL